MRSGRWFLAAAATVALSLALSGCSLAHPALIENGDPSGEGLYGASAADWRNIQGRVTEFGLDYLVLRHPGDTPRVTSVTLDGVHGNLKIVRALFVPFGGIGGGWAWNNPIWKTGLPDWSGRVNVPGTLHYEKENAAEAAKAGSGRSGRWQVVVGVRTSGQGGTAKRVIIHYTEGGHSFELTGIDSMSLVRHADQALIH
ncbi:MAG: hypothetical protein JWP75_1640 [Frondihabitans sp.]|nr:hypothetical protein [Frondihabitans sp.]